MKINKHTPPDDLKSKLLQNLSDPKNEKYAKKLDDLDSGHYGKAVIKAMFSAAAVLIVAVAVGIFALVGREIWHRGTVAPASAPDYPNHIFIEGCYGGIAQNGFFSQALAMGRVVTFNEFLSNECLYDINGNEIKEIFINVSELKWLNRDETQTIAQRLKKYASSEFRNYYKFTLPVTMDDKIPINTGTLDYAFSKDEIKNGSLYPEHKYVTAYKLNIKPLVKFKSSLTKSEIERINEAIEYEIDKKTPAYSADIDGDGKDEKLVSVSSDKNYTSNAFSYVMVFDDEEMWYLYTAYQSLQGEEIDKRELIDLIDFDLDGKYEPVLANDGGGTYVYSAREGGADEVFSGAPKYTPSGLTLREFAARVANMAIGTPYDPEYPSDENCEWYFRYVDTENINLNREVSYNNIFFGVQAFAKMYNIELDGWDEATIWLPIADIYDPMTTAPRDKAEELLKKAETAFKNSKFKIKIDRFSATSIEIKDRMTPNSVTITNKDEVAKMVEFLNKTPIKTAEYSPGLPTSGAPTISVKDSDGNSIFGCMFEADTFYVRGCKYTLDGDYFADLIK